jgi:ABC-type transporter Mla subunit MlaD
VNQKARYFKIGLFVIGAVSLAVVAVIILGAGKWFEAKTMVETYFIESVQGLEVGAPVRIHGVPVGRVESIHLAREEYDLPMSAQGKFPFKGVVVVRMSVRPSVVVRSPEEDEKTIMKIAADAGFRLRLASQGITGVLYIESEFLDPERYPPMAIAWKPKTPYIPSAPSTISELGTDLRSIARKLDQVEFEKVTKDLDTMIVSVTQFVKDVQSQQLGAEAKQVMTELRSTVQEVRRVLDSPHVAKALADFRRTADDLSHTAKTVRLATEQLPDLMTRLNKSVRRVDALLVGQGEKVDDVFENLRSVSEELRYLTKTMEKYPSQVLFGEPPPRSQSVKR